MSVLSLSQIIGGNQRGLYQLNERVRTAVSNINKTAQSQSSSGVVQDFADTAGQPFQTRISDLRNAAKDVAKDVTKLAYQSRGANQISQQLAELEAMLQGAASRPLDEKSLKKINDFLKNSRSEINRTAQLNALGETFDNNAASNNATQKQGADTSGSFKVGADMLLGEETEVKSVSDIRNLITVVQNAAGQVGDLAKEIHSTLEGYELVSSHIEISLENQMAAKALFPSHEDVSLLDILLNQSEQSALVQGNRLPPELLNLI